MIYKYIRTRIKKYILNKNVKHNPKKTLKEIITEIDTKKKWDVKSINDILDQLYEWKRINIEEKSTKNTKDNINFYIEYLNHQLNVLNSNRNQLLTIIATIFLPLGFIVGFLGMNFKSMGTPTEGKGIFNLFYIIRYLFFLYVLNKNDFSYKYYMKNKCNINYII